MKNYTILLLAVLALSITSCTHRIADLTMISTRNVDTKTEYKELQRYIVGKDKALHNILFIGPLDAPDLEDAVDKAVMKVPSGELMKNVVIRERYNFYLLFATRVFIVEGDVWGIPGVNKSVVKSVSAKIEFKAGDKVTFKNMGKMVEGTIIGVNQNTAVVKFNAMIGGEKNKEVEYEKLTKIE